mmetsp:Transcript_11550/g.13604  ORF Transcript_11550/g.13604 Transcript_11550/m.13604 type:complete len:244 (-) Transcript_11550:110-841(-)
MVKRKGGEFAESPTTAFVTTIASSPTITSSSTASAPAISPFNTSSFTWEETSLLMTQLLDHYVGPAASDNISLIKECASQNEDLSNWKNSFLLESQSIKGRIQSRIDECHMKYQQEEGALEEQRKHLVTLEGEEHLLREKHTMLRKEKGEIEQRIDQYKIEASQGVEKIDEVEEMKKMEVPRLQQQISLYASISGIKWEYDCVDSLAGEVEVPLKCLHKRFAIDKEEHTPFEIADMLWGMTET